MKTDSIYQYIRSVQLNREKDIDFSQYPFCLPAVKSLVKLDLHPRVTFVVGENGSGKSTILEAIAIAFGFNAEGGTKNFNFSSRETHSELHQYIQLIKGAKHPKDGFFLRAESFYNVATNIDELDSLPSFGPSLIHSYGGVSLHKQSHGESFLSVFLNRFGGKGVYILDEPEAALSPTRQMSMITRLHELVKKDSQFIIATHSPILMAYPDAVIYDIDHGFKAVQYEETEHYQVMRTFINDTKKMMDILME